MKSKTPYIYLILAIGCIIVVAIAHSMGIAQSWYYVAAFACYAGNISIAAHYIQKSSEDTRFSRSVAEICEIDDLADFLFIDEVPVMPSPHESLRIDDETILNFSLGMMYITHDHFVKHSYSLDNDKCRDIIRFLQKSLGDVLPPNKEHKRTAEQFTCPECGGNSFRSFGRSGGPVTRACRGDITGDVYGYEDNCSFEWDEREDYKYIK